MNQNDYVEHLIDRIAERGVAFLPLEEAAWLLGACPVLGGAGACIVLQVENMIVGLTACGSFWIAERIAVGEGA